MEIRCEKYRKRFSVGMFSAKSSRTDIEVICSDLQQSCQARRTMGKSKKHKHNRSSHAPYDKGRSSNNFQVKKPSKNPQQPQKKISQPPPTIPFHPSDRILLIGEGDFSYAHSLYTHHDCRHLIATCYDSDAQLAEKYPQSSAYIQDVQSAAREDEDTEIKILYGVDATKLGKAGSTVGGGKEIKKGGFDRVIFNFPHVGGVTTDVNRQVRYNQGISTLILLITRYPLRRTVVEST